LAALVAEAMAQQRRQHLVVQVLPTQVAVGAAAHMMVELEMAEQVDPVLLL
jgi:hypothetical protein